MNSTAENTQQSAPSSMLRAAPLRPAIDMPHRWENVDEDFDTAAERIIQAHKRDGEAVDVPLADIKTWSIVPHGGQFALAPIGGHRPPIPLRNSALSHLMTRIGAPAEFIRRLPPPLQLANANYLLTTHDDKSPATLRLRGNEVSSIVSERYAPLDPEELLCTLREALARHNVLAGVRICSVASGVVDNLRIILPGECVAVKPGDVSHVGLDLSTSSFGRSAIHLAPMVWRLICTNGLRAPERRGKLTFRHAGDRRRLRNAVMEAVPSALTHARGLMSDWQAAVDFMVEDVQRQVAALQDLTAGERKAFETELRKEGGTAEVPDHLPLYSVVNALTATAKAHVPARRLELEATAGEVLRRQLGRAA